ncbi:MAG TPA: hypothetical protein VFR82_04850 [Nitrospira sp.]|nr:hypothetical protein [Nitrospira sp.]
MTFTASRPPWYSILVFSALLAGNDLLSVTGQATASPQQVPWECSNYTDEAQTRCLNAFMERQQEQIGRLESQLQSQQDIVGQLKGQVERQTAATAQLQQQLAQPPVTTAVPPPYVYPYAFAYPPVGIGLYLGRPWIGPGFYGYYGRPWGQRFYYYGHHGRRR